MSTPGGHRSVSEDDYFNIHLKITFRVQLDYLKRLYDRTVFQLFHFKESFISHVTYILHYFSAFLFLFFINGLHSVSVVLMTVLRYNSFVHLTSLTCIYRESTNFIPNLYNGESYFRESIVISLNK